MKHQVNMSASDAPPPPASDAPMNSDRNVMKIEETMDERLGGPQKCGRLWVEYWRTRGLTPTQSMDKIPNVDVKFKVYRISDFDGKRGTFYVEFVLMLDWVDPSLELAKKDRDGVGIPDFHEHFWPKPELLNLTEQDGTLVFFYYLFLYL